MSTPPTDAHLRTLVAHMAPKLHAAEYVFCSMPQLPVSLNPLFTFREDEGVSVVVTREEAAREGCVFQYPCRLITLTVHSSLDAVGFLAVVTQHLAAAGISANAVSAFHHDHLFVPVDRAEEAMRVLLRLAERGF